ncbi:hypothetical protein GBA52_014057 [Prunus armeniaca]|nr:hypothetical protein GBA52_014057 [Prunus armeniaca]
MLKEQVTIPKERAIAEGLVRKKTVKLQDPAGRSWIVKLRVHNSVSIESKGNQVRVKEEIIDLETENYNEDCENKTSIANRRNRNAMSGKKPTTDYVEETSSECISLKSDNRCFMETMKRHYRYCLMIPKKLAIAEGLKSARNVTLRDPNGRLCLLNL